ncbi:H-NS family nucleoid-associated regulatory protein [Variovorax saccharolyticus]|uniref:H-NS family nucleoid-associated regulatory protein n=1 Tax=Variovorax saccharolyticus TaxID=3053516 RepID=UPI0025773054|nr:H-NS family nucleoid-associated regulatory protein [Variovorax sp. J31P216]MDM0030434.1 H-NS family nucleoid-associated regulatory protein [Variovorax sp. J31P216]
MKRFTVRTRFSRWRPLQRGKQLELIARWLKSPLRRHAPTKTSNEEALIHSNSNECTWIFQRLRSIRSKLRVSTIPTQQEMAQTYKQIQKQIEQLQKQADALRNSEVKGVIERIKVAIAHYGLNAAHLGLESRASVSKKIRAAGSKGVKAHAAFADGNGNAWSGRGRRPRWLLDALAAGRSLENFRAGAGADVSAASATAPQAEGAAMAAKPARKFKRAPSKVTYRDDAGHSWTGRGPRPGWLKAELDAGKSLQDFLQ